MLHLYKKSVLLVVSSIVALCAMNDMHAASYCVASPVECTSYVHPLGFTGYTRPTYAEIWGMSATNVTNIIGVFNGTLLVSTGARSLTTVYQGYTTGPGASTTPKDTISLSEFGSLAEMDILMSVTDCDIGNLAIYSGSVYMLSNTGITTNSYGSQNLKIPGSVKTASGAGFYVTTGPYTFHFNINSDNGVSSSPYPTITSNGRLDANSSVNLNLWYASNSASYLMGLYWGGASSRALCCRRV